MTEKFLRDFFSKLKADDFKKDSFLESFYNFYKKEKSSNLFDCYIEYILRNKNYKDYEKNHEITKLYEELKNKMIGDSKQKDKKISIKKTIAIEVLSDFIKQSSIISDDNEDSDENDQTIHDDTVGIMISDMQKDGRSIPNAVKDSSFMQRNKLLEIWYDTKHLCHNLKETQEELCNLLHKSYLIDLKKVTYKTSNITFFPETKELIRKYSNVDYKTNIKIINISPIDFIYRESDKYIYICAGSYITCGGYSEQGIRVVESPLYLNTTYSISLENTVIWYPLDITDSIFCPNVLIMKENYNKLPISSWKKIAILNVPSPYKPKTNIKEQDYNKFDDALFDNRTIMTEIKEELLIKKILGAFELCLYLGYDNVILDDRGIEDNWIPVHQTATIMKNIAKKFSGRFKNIIFCVENIKIYNIFNTIV
jgi:hypothetical protein